VKHYCSDQFGISPIFDDDICGYGRNMEDTNINLDEL
jgi:hypothetical protein